MASDVAIPWRYLTRSLALLSPPRHTNKKVPCSSLLRGKASFLKVLRFIFVIALVIIALYIAFEKNYASSVYRLGSSYPLAPLNLHLVLGLELI